MTDCFIHETAVIDEPCVIGAGTKIWHFSHVNEECHNRSKIAILVRTVLFLLM